MKLTASVLCSIAILSQIILSMGTVMHRGDCQSSVSSELNPHSTSHPKTKAKKSHHGCGCSHHSHEKSAPAPTPVQTQTVDSTVCEIVSPLPQPPCHCQSDPTTKFIIADYSVDHRKELEVIQSLPNFNFAFCDYSLNLSKIGNPSTAPPPPQFAPHVTHTSSSFVAIHLGIYLL